MITSNINSIDPNYSYQYDPNGNLTTITGPAGNSSSYLYDSANHLTSATNPTGTVNYGYNGFWNRVSQTFGGATTNYFFDPTGGIPQLLAEMPGSGSTNPATYYLPGLGQDNGKMSYFGTDALGSVRQITDSNGVMQYAANFDPYGSLLEQNFGTANTSLGYTGAPSDPSGLVYLNARFYNPSLGSFQTHDPIEGALGSPASFNGYGYVSGNPINNVDPTGMCDNGLDIVQCGLQNIEIAKDGAINLVDAYAQQAGKAAGFLPEAAVKSVPLFMSDLSQSQSQAAATYGDLCGGLVNSNEGIPQLNGLRCSIRTNLSQLPSISQVGGVGAVYLDRLNSLGRPRDPNADTNAYQNGYDATRAVVIAAPLVASWASIPEVGLGLTDIAGDVLSADSSAAIQQWENEGGTINEPQSITQISDVSESTSNSIIRVRSYYRNHFSDIRDTMRIIPGDPEQYGNYVYFEYPIETPNNIGSIQKTTASFGVPLNRRGGFVEYNIDTNIWNIEPDSAFVGNPKVKNAWRINMGAASFYDLNASGVDAQFFDFAGNLLSER